MGISGYAALLLTPAQDGHGPSRPALGFESVRARILVILQIEQAHMPQRLRPETADFQVVFKNRQRLTEIERPRLKELPLIAKARSPSQHRANVEPLAFDLPKHVFGQHALRGAGVMG